MKNITLLGIDLAKDVFQLHGVNEHGKKILGKKVKRSELPTLIANLASCKIVMEACGSSNYWSRKFMSYGHEVFQISPQHVKPFVQGNKNDKNDARAIVIAAQQDNMPTVPIKTIEQQEVQMLHRYRESLIHERTALGNRIRGYLREAGLFLVQGLSQVRKQIPLILEDAENELTSGMREIIFSCHKKLLDLDKEIEKYTQKIEHFCKQSSVCERLMKLSGVGPIIASIVYATMGSPTNFKNGRHFAAFLGLVPKEHSSGGKQCLMSISKRGDRYIRSLLIHGGRAVVKNSGKKTDYLNCWIQRLHKERGYNKAAVAVANKNARHMWAIMAYDDKYVDHMKLCA
ncbi:transposase [Legionella steigerwaltii]|uniref:Transposase n=1 Tax=Legionella steigerwaltii TaxID=460 RepID=A0A378L4I0_9GAMM|nr:IS110 family transposase [Legionella steigerwaltii]KTD77436.1 transposase [Legionella steigerwaltii]STY21713.1 transposase [Legionella steigerwaltii]STY22709.1 transposase [Legionella steigerwaltii]STY23557.1 transposase [Legionella steigerwaltii]STY23873.1 transposase [Legionella steigerwaltii]